MHVSPSKHSYGSVTDGRTDRRTDRQTDRQTDDGQSDPYVSLCFAGDTGNTKNMVRGPSCYVSNKNRDIQWMVGWLLLVVFED